MLSFGSMFSLVRVSAVTERGVLLTMKTKKNLDYTDTTDSHEFLAETLLWVSCIQKFLKDKYYCPTSER